MEACLAFTHVHKFVPINRLIDRESDLRISILGSKSISHQDVIPTQLRRATVIGVRGQLDLQLYWTNQANFQARGHFKSHPYVKPQFGALTNGTAKCSTAQSIVSLNRRSIKGLATSGSILLFKMVKRLNLQGKTSQEESLYSILYMITYSITLSLLSGYFRLSAATSPPSNLNWGSFLTVTTLHPPFFWEHSANLLKDT